MLLAAPGRPDFHRAVTGHVVRQYPLPGVAVPRGAVVTVRFDFGDGEDGRGLREPLRGAPPPGGLRRAPGEPEGPYAAPSRP